MLEFTLNFKFVVEFASGSWLAVVPEIGSFIEFNPCSVEIRRTIYQFCSAERASSFGLSTATTVTATAVVVPSLAFVSRFEGCQTSRRVAGRWWATWTPQIWIANLQIDLWVGSLIWYSPKYQFFLLSFGNQRRLLLLNHYCYCSNWNFPEQLIFLLNSALWITIGQI